MAARFPNSRITAVSNSMSQRKFIEKLAYAQNLNNVTILTRDVSELEDFASALDKFDRVVSIEMLEHFRNYEVLLNRISKWLRPDGKVFIHIFTHKQFPYLFETEGADNWMGKYFFTGGQMPSHSLLFAFQKDLRIEKDWTWKGIHYRKTSEAWLENLHLHRDEIMSILEKVYGKIDAIRWFHRWKVFFLAVAELFGYDKGSEWGVSHYLLSQKG